MHAPHEVSRQVGSIGGARKVYRAQALANRSKVLAVTRIARKQKPTVSRMLDSTAPGIPTPVGRVGIPGGASAPMLAG